MFAFSGSDLSASAEISSMPVAFQLFDGLPDFCLGHLSCGY